MVRNFRSFILFISFHRDLIISWLKRKVKYKESRKHFQLNAMNGDANSLQTFSFSFQICSERLLTQLGELSKSK